MNIIEAMKSGMPFTHQGILGGWICYNGQVIHSDSLESLFDTKFVREMANSYSIHSRNTIQLEWFEDILFSDKFFVLSL